MKRILLVPDPVLVLLALIATVMGLFFVFDAGYAHSIGSKQGDLIPPEFRTQVILMIPAIFAGILCSRIKESTWLKSGKWLIVATILMLLAVEKLGVRENNAQRWIGVGIFRIQPAEFAKLACVIYLASAFATRRALPKLKPNKGAAYWLDNAFVPKFLRVLPGIAVLIVVGLIDHEKDLGTAGVIAAAAFLMFLPAGVSWRSMASAIVLCVLGAWVLVKQEPYRLERITNHESRWSPTNVDDDAFQTVQSELAMASGGVKGVGIGIGRAKQVIPAATTDFILATVGEELGLVGVLTVLVVIGGLVWRLIYQASRATSRFSGLILYGIGAWIGVQACVNVTMANGHLPAIGIPLPFISYGGSSLVALWCAIGLAQAAIAASQTKKTVASAEATDTFERAAVTMTPPVRNPVTSTPRRA